MNIYLSIVELPATQFSTLLGNSLKCNKWTIFESLLIRLHSYETYFAKQKDPLQNILSIFDKHEAELLHAGDDNYARKIHFLISQFRLLRQQPKYANDIILWAASFFFAFPGAYKYLRQSGLLTLPHTSYLRKLCGNLRSEAGVTN